MTAATAVQMLRLDARWTRRARARLLLLDLRSEDAGRALAAERRFRILPGYDELPAGRLIAWGRDLGLRHALAVIRAEDASPDGTAFATTRAPTRIAGVPHDVPRRLFRR